MDSAIIAFKKAIKTNENANVGVCVIVCTRENATVLHSLAAKPLLGDIVFQNALSAATKMMWLAGDNIRVHTREEFTALSRDARRTALYSYLTQTCIA